MPRQPRQPVFPEDIDPLVVPLIHAMAAMGLTTTNSCQGHLPKDRQTPGSGSFPCITFEHPGKQAPLFLLAHIISPRGWMWYRQNTGTTLLTHRWQVTATSSPPYLNPENFGYFVLEPTFAALGAGDDLPNYPRVLQQLHEDLQKIPIGIDLYLQEYGIPNEPRRSRRHPRAPRRK